MPRKNPAATRANLLRAAADEILAHGILELTLDHVAAAAAVSKGGLLHHFPTKLALLEGVVGDLAAQFMGRLEQALAEEPPDRPGRWSRSYVRATFDASAAEAKLISAILAASLSTYPQLADTYRRIAASFVPPADDRLPPGRQLLIQVACDGVIFGELTGSLPSDPAHYAVLFETLVELCQ